MLLPNAVKRCTKILALKWRFGISNVILDEMRKNLVLHMSLATVHFECSDWTTILW